MSERILYLDCFAGISGDMTVAALADLGADVAALERELAKLGLSSEYSLGWDRVVKTGVSALKFDVRPAAGQLPQGAESRDRHEERHHPHDHPHDHEPRGYGEIVELIRSARLEDAACERAVAVFTSLGKAEAKIHGIPLEQVHFHEIGAIDSIVDIVCASILLGALRIERVVASPVPLGTGMVRTMHGLYPVPAPATLELLRSYPIRASAVEGEITTPTGAAFLATFASERGPLPSMTVEAVGYGAGNRDYATHPNVLRAVLGTPAAGAK